jgi:hypothetical protein
MNMDKTTPELAEYFTRLMVEKGARTFGDLMALMNTPSRSEETPPPLSWTFTITLEDIAGADPLEINPCDVLTYKARERMMREFGLFAGVRHSDVERQIVTLRGLEDRCRACGCNIYHDDSACQDCGMAVAAE